MHPGHRNKGKGKNKEKQNKSYSSKQKKLDDALAKGLVAPAKPAQNKIVTLKTFPDQSKKNVDVTSTATQNEKLNYQTIQTKSLSKTDFAP